MITTSGLFAMLLTGRLSMGYSFNIYSKFARAISLHELLLLHVETFVLLLLLLLLLLPLLWLLKLLLLWSK